MKTFNEFKLLEAERINTQSFSQVNYLTDEEADKLAAKMYADDAEKMTLLPEVIDWAFCSSNGEEFKKIGEKDWNKKNSTASNMPYMSSGNQSVSGLIFTLKMKFPIKKEIPNFKVQIGDVPEYTFKLRLSFNTTGNQAYTSILNDKGDSFITLSDTSDMSLIITKVKKMDPIKMGQLHKMFYHSWIETLDKHQFKGYVTGKKYGI